MPTKPPTLNHEARIAHLERSLLVQRRFSMIAVVMALVLAAGAWTAEHGKVLRVRGLIVEDSLGRARVVLGAPLMLEGRRDTEAGVGVAVLSPEGKLRAVLGAPAPAPQVDGKVLRRAGGDVSGGVGGLTIFDTNGNERGGIGAYPDGRANVCLDYARGVKEAACLVVYPKDEYAGLTVNGTPGQGYERASLIIGGSGVAQLKVSAIDGQERAILRADGSGPAQLLVYDSSTKKYLDVMPAPRR
jgi:hypothetical protein